MLRKIRITAAAVFFTVITLLLLDFTGTLHAWFGWMAKVQLLPAVLAVNAGVVAALVLLTLLFGRVYCSVICPLGVFQDVVSRAAVAAGEPADASRRKFLSLVGVMACATVRAQEKKVDGGLAVIEQKKIPRRTTPITPPGSLAVRNMEAHCTGCQLCVAVCPN